MSQATHKSIAAALYHLLDEQKDGKALAKKLAAYLQDTRQTKHLSATLRELEQLRLDKDGILEVTAASARPLSDASKQAIKALFDAKHIIIHEQQDPSLIGGVKVRAHDQEVDLSVRTRLQRLKTRERTAT